MICKRTGFTDEPKRFPSGYRRLLYALLSLALFGAAGALAFAAGPQNEQSPKKGAKESAEEARRQQEVGRQTLPQLTAEEKQTIESALPQKAQARPKRKRKILVVTLNMRDGVERRGHTSFPTGISRSRRWARRPAPTKRFSATTWKCSVRPI